MKNWFMFMGSWILMYLETNYQEAYWNAVNQQKIYYWLMYRSLN